MTVAIKVPAVGESISEGTIARWLKKDRLLASGLVVLCLLAAVAMVSQERSPQRTPVITQLGESGWVFALAVNGSDLIAAGSFTTAGGTNASNIARWDGSSWWALSSGVNSTVEATSATGLPYVTLNPLPTPNPNPNGANSHDVNVSLYFQVRYISLSPFPFISFHF